MSDPQKMLYCLEIDGGYEVVTDTINKLNLAEQIVSIVHHSHYVYLVFYIGKFEHYTTEVKE